MNIEKLVFKGFGPDEPVIIAGPCGAETHKQIWETACQLSARGIRIFRAGVWKPRTRPGNFEGAGEAGLPWMKEVKEKTGMLTATEVATPQHVRAALEAGIDIFWIGARTVTNPFAMQDLADALSGTDVPVLVKNPVSPDLDLWIGAMQRLYSAGVKKIGAVHRGFKVCERKLYRNEPIWHIPIELKRRYPDLTLLCDPSHIGGKREYVGPLSQQALDLNFDGLMIESHFDPDSALSDAFQQITPETLHRIVSQLVVREKGRTSDHIALLRQRIDEIDEDLLSLLASRMHISDEIGTCKKEQNMPILQSERYSDLLELRGRTGERLGLSPEFVEKIIRLIHEESVKVQMKNFSD